MIDGYFSSLAELFLFKTNYTPAVYWYRKEVILKEAVAFYNKIIKKMIKQRRKNNDSNNLQ